MEFKTKKEVTVFSVLLLAYMIISFVMFMATSSGWNSFFKAMYFGGILFPFLLLIYLIRLFTIRRKHLYKIVLVKDLTIMLLITQIIALITNTGDCINTRGDSVFILKVFGNNSCSESPLNIILGNISLISIVIYSILSIIIIFTLFQNLGRKDEHY